MKKIKKIAYVVLIVIIIILSLTIYTNASKNKDVNQKNKTLTEIKFIESKLVNLLNTMNNVVFENYQISVSEVKENQDSESSENSSSSGSNSSGGESKDSEKGQSDSTQSSSGSSESSSSDTNKDEVKKFELKSENILTKEDEINWDNIKSEVETLYNSIPSITLDLYQVNLNQEDILNFNKEYDNLTIAVKDEKKRETLNQLTILYEYMPKFIKNVTDEQLYQIVLETKTQIFKAYTKLDEKNWEEMEKDMQNAINTYNRLMSNTNIDISKQYNINRAYIMINELQNAVKIKDEVVFLIKYKNLLEELNDM